MSRLLIVGLLGLLDPLADGELPIEAAAGLRGFLGRHGAKPIRHASVCIEDQWLGLSSDLPRPLGPLCLAAFGRPAEIRETALACGVLSLDNGRIEPRPDDAMPEEYTTIFEASAKLQTRFLSTWRGRLALNGLMLEGQLGGITMPPKDAYTRAIYEVLPEGDFERSLRKFIDDSVNLLDGLPLNRIREEEGRRKLNLLWPFANGFGFRLQSVPVRWGMSMSLCTDDVRFAGLGKLAGFDTQWVTQPFDFRQNGSSVQILVGKPFRGMGNDVEEVRRKIEVWDGDISGSLLKNFKGQEDRLILILTGEGRSFWSDSDDESKIPWRALLEGEAGHGIPLNEQVSRTFREWMATVSPPGGA